jgi:hypothetical protein
MGIGVITDMKVYEDQVAGGFIERLAQNIQVFNGASAGTIALRSEDKTGDFAREAFWKLVTGMSRRDDTSTAAQEPKMLSQDEDITVKIKAKFDQFAMTEDSFYSSGRSPDEFVYVLGQQMADQMTQYMLNRTIASISTALSGVDELNLDVTGDGSSNKLDPMNLNRVIALMGDKQQRVSAWVMAGAGVNSLAGSMMGTGVTYNDSGISVYGGGAPSLGKPIISVDTDTLAPEGKFVVLGLVKDAGVCFQSERVRSIFERKGGNENIIITGQGESAFNLGVKGFKWDTQNGGRNPNDAAVNTASNWDKVVTSHKDCAGVRLVTLQG